MVKNMIKGYFPISKVLVFGGNSFVGKNDLKSFSFWGVIATYVEKMKILDYFMISNGKEYD